MSLNSDLSCPYVAVLSTKKQGLLPLEVRTFISTLSTIPEYWSWTPKSISLTQGAYQNADSCSPDSHRKTKPKNLYFFYGTSPFLQFIDKETETKRGIVTCPGASGVGLRPDPTLVMFSAGPPAPSPPPALSQILHLWQSPRPRTWLCTTWFADHASCSHQFFFPLLIVTVLYWSIIYMQDNAWILSA